MIWDFCNKIWRIMAAATCYCVFGVGILCLTAILFLLVRPLPLGQQRKQVWTRYMIARSAAGFLNLMRLLGLLRTVYSGVPYLQASGQLIIANHPTLIDVLFLMALVPTANCIVKAELWENYFTMGLLTLAGYIPNNKEGLLEQAVSALKAGQSLIVFPEGTRSRPGESVKFKRGLANIAVRANCPIVPVRLDCNPPSLAKQQHWYDVPDHTATFSVQVLKPLAIADCIDINRPYTIQARHLVRYLQVFYQQWLYYPPAASVQLDTQATKLICSGK